VRWLLLALALTACKARVPEWLSTVPTPPGYYDR
jgi:hypothetical protein